MDGCCRRGKRGGEGEGGDEAVRSKHQNLISLGAKNELAGVEWDGRTCLSQDQILGLEWRQGKILFSLLFS